jgi:hypothetical protein
VADIKELMANLRALGFDPATAEQLRPTTQLVPRAKELIIRAEDLDDETLLQMIAGALAELQRRHGLTLTAADPEE